jgi:IS30 family transposase
LYAFMPRRDGPLGGRLCSSDHQAIDQTLGIQTYFADPYCSWKRGSNENFNGLLRQYIPKKRRMEIVTDEELTVIEK